MEESERTLEELVEGVRQSYDCDVISYAGPMVRPHDDLLIDEILDKRQHDAVLFWLTTRGGDPTVAYRIARSLRKNYKEVLVYVNSTCASAGTMLTLGAHRVIIDEHAEFGPVDIQLSDREEVGERVSGLTSRSALALASEEAPATFEKCFVKLRIDLGLSTKMAAETAAKLTDSTIGKLFSQIDPMRLAGDGRSVQIIEGYAERIATDNVKPGAIDELVRGYPDHNFVIDPEEAKDKLFVKTEPACDELAALGQKLKSGLARYLYKNEVADYFWPTTLDESPSSTEDATTQSNDRPDEEPAEGGNNSSPKPPKKPRKSKPATKRSRVHRGGGK